MPLAIVAGLFANTDRLDPYWVWLNYMDLRWKITKREVYKRERITSNALHLCTISMYLCGDELEGGWGELAFVSLPYERSPPMQTAASSR